MIACRHSVTLSDLNTSAKFYYSNKKKLTRKELREALGVTANHMRGEHRCQKCGWMILYHEAHVDTSNRWSGVDYIYHSWCHDDGYRCEESVRK